MITTIICRVTQTTRIVFHSYLLHLTALQLSLVFYRRSVQFLVPMSLYRILIVIRQDLFLLFYELTYANKNRMKIATRTVVATMAPKDRPYNAKPIHASTIKINIVMLLFLLSMLHFFLLTLSIPAKPSR